MSEPLMTVDPRTGAIYVYLDADSRGKPQVHHTDRLAEDPMINADYDAKGRLLGVEILP